MSLKEKIMKDTRVYGFKDSNLERGGGGGQGFMR